MLGGEKGKNNLTPWGGGPDVPEPNVFPVPLSDGTVAKLQLPCVLSKADAEKICAVVHALAEQK